MFSSNGSGFTKMVVPDFKISIFEWEAAGWYHQQWYLYKATIAYELEFDWFRELFLVTIWSF